MLIKCQPSSLWTSAWIQRLRGDRSFTIQYIYSKHLTILYLYTWKENCTLRYNTLTLWCSAPSVCDVQYIPSFFFFYEILKFIFCCNHLFPKFLIYFCSHNRELLLTPPETIVSQGSLWFQSKPAPRHRLHICVQFNQRVMFLFLFLSLKWNSPVFQKEEEKVCQMSKNIWLCVLCLVLSCLVNHLASCVCFCEPLGCPDPPRGETNALLDPGLSSFAEVPVDWDKGQLDAFKNSNRTQLLPQWAPSTVPKQRPLSQTSKRTSMFAPLF